MVLLIFSVFEMQKSAEDQRKMDTVCLFGFFFFLHNSLVADSGFGSVLHFDYASIPNS